MTQLEKAIQELSDFWRGVSFDSRPLTKELDERYLHILSTERDAATTIVQKLQTTTRLKDFATVSGPAAAWEYFTALFQTAGRFHEALATAFGLYQSMTKTEHATNTRLHKGMPLVRIADAYRGLGYVVHEERYLMLTLCEDAIREQGHISPNSTGIYYRLVWGLGFSDAQIRHYATEFFKAYSAAADNASFPEALLQDIDRERRWQLRAPSPSEMSTYEVNSRYVTHLIDKLGDGAGRGLERIAEYVLSCMAGCRAQRRVNSRVTDFDVVCSMNGNYHDFRSEFGRYFVAECKDWRDTAGISVIAKFCRILDSTKCRFGILFLKNGLSGTADGKHAAREQQKIFQDRGLVIVVIEASDLQGVANGDNFIQTLRQKYEAVRLDLQRV